MCPMDMLRTVHPLAHLSSLRRGHRSLGSGSHSLHRLGYGALRHKVTQKMCAVDMLRIIHLVLPSGAFVRGHRRVTYTMPRGQRQLAVRLRLRGSGRRDQNWVIGHAVVILHQKCAVDSSVRVLGEVHLQLPLFTLSP